MREVTYDVVIENIKGIIQQKGMKQCVVAERSGFTAQEFSNVLNDRRKLLRIEHIPLIAKALDVDVKDLFYLPEEKEVG